MQTAEMKFSRGAARQTLTKRQRNTELNILNLNYSIQYYRYN